MDAQFAINILIGIVGILGGWWMKVMWQSLRDLQRADATLTTKVAEIEVLVVGTYVKRDELERMLTALFAKLDKIYDKLDGKMDKA